MNSSRRTARRRSDGAEERPAEQEVSQRSKLFTKSTLIIIGVVRRAAAWRSCWSMCQVQGYSARRTASSGRRTTAQVDSWRVRLARQDRSKPGRWTRMQQNFARVNVDIEPRSARRSRSAEIGAVNKLSADPHARAQGRPSTTPTPRTSSAETRRAASRTRYKTASTRSSAKDAVQDVVFSEYRAY